MSDQAKIENKSVFRKLMWFRIEIDYLTTYNHESTNLIPYSSALVHQETSFSSVALTRATVIRVHRHSAHLSSCQGDVAVFSSLIMNNLIIDADSRTECEETIHLKNE